jgi:hypothetical protein
MTKSRWIPAAFCFPFQRLMPGISGQFAGHRKVALLNDALLQRLSRPVPGA